MRRFAALTAIVLALSLLKAACGSDDDPAAQGSGGDATTTEDGRGGAGHDDEATPVADGARRIEVTGNDFSFDPDEIRVQSGDDIAIVLTSKDILHDFTIDELDAHVAANRGETEEGGFTAEDPGRYTYYCTVAGHRDAGMEGTLVVE